LFETIDDHVVIDFIKGIR